MSQGSEVAEQLTREAVKITESALKLTALGAKNLALLCMALVNENPKLKGKTNMINLLKSGKELKVFDVKASDMGEFARHCKQYGVLFSSIKHSRDENGYIDVLVRAEDTSKVNRVLEKMKYHQKNEEVKPQKKDMSHVQQESKSKGLEHGSEVNPSRRNNKKSVRETLASLNKRMPVEPIIIPKER